MFYDGRIDGYVVYDENGDDDDGDDDDNDHGVGDDNLITIMGHFLVGYGRVTKGSERIHCRTCLIYYP